MTQIPPRGTPEFEEYKKTVEEAYRNGAKVQVQEDIGIPPFKRWEDIEDPVWFWEGCLYRIAPNQPQSLQNQAPEPSMTSTEQRIVKALDQIVYGLAEVSSITADQLDAGDARYNRLHDYTDEASKLVTALVADLPLPSPSEALSEAVAPAPSARNGQHEAVQFASHSVGDRVEEKATGLLGSISKIDSLGMATVILNDGRTIHRDLCALENLGTKPHEAPEATPTGAVRSSVYPKGAKFPIRLDLLFRNAAGLRRLAETWAEGNEKYGPDNWMKGFSESCIISHTLEHVRLYLAGDKSEDHLAHGAWNLLALCWVEENRPELLDLTKPNQKP